MNDQYYQDLFMKLVNLPTDEWKRMDTMLSEISHITDHNCNLDKNLFVKEWVPENFDLKSIWSLNKKLPDNLIVMSVKRHTLDEKAITSVFTNSNVLKADNQSSVFMMYKHIDRDSDVNILIDIPDNVEYKSVASSEEYAVAA